MFTIPRSESLNFSGPDTSAPLSESMPDAHGWGPYFKAIVIKIARAEFDSKNLYITATDIAPHQLSDSKQTNNQNPTERIEAPNISDSEDITSINPSKKQSIFRQTPLLTLLPLAIFPITTTTPPRNSLFTRPPADNSFKPHPNIAG